jgi:hypothetical protein
VKRLIYQVSVGKPSKLYEHCTRSVENYCKEHKIDYVKQTSPKLWIRPDPFTSNRSAECQARPLPLPIFEKENAFEYLHRYDQVAIVDSDIWVRPNAPNIFHDFDSGVDFGAVVEREMPITKQYMNKIINYSNMQYSSLKDVDFSPDPRGYEFMNMGLMVMNKSILKYLRGESPQEFLGRPEFKRFIDGVGPWKWSTDQTLLNYWIRKEKMNIQRLHWKWNGLYTANTNIRECHFVHFFLKDKLPNNGENVDELMRIVQ